MLNLTEKYILNLFMEIYEMNLKNEIIKNDKNLNIIFDESHIPNKIIEIFFNKANKYMSFILYLSIMYAIGCSETVDRMKFLNFIKDYKENINNRENLDMEFKRNCVYNAIKYLIKKKNNSISLIKEEECFKVFNTLFQHINQKEIIYSLKDIERLVLEKLLEKYNNLNKENVILEIINSNKFDNDILKLSSGLLKDSDDLKFFKNYLIRLIILDTYIVHSNLVKEKEKELFVIPFLNSKNSCLMTPELMYINNCLDNKKFIMPSNKMECLNIIKNFLVCFYDSEYRQKNLETVEKEKKKELSLIDPLYKLG